MEAVGDGLAEPGRLVMSCNTINSKPFRLEQFGKDSNVKELYRTISQTRVMSERETHTHTGIMEG